MTTKARRHPVVIFDFGGVLVDWDPRYLYRPLFDGDDAAMEQFLDEIDFYEWNFQQDKGRTFAEGTAELSGQFPHYAELIAAYDRRWEESIAGPIPDTVEILHHLKEREYPLFALSNWSAETFYRIRPSLDFMNWFDGIVLSGEVKLAKPDPAIYAVLLEQVNDSPGNCLFIDDSEVNIAAARELGFNAIQFESPSQLRLELLNQGLI
ncbi:MAG: HAD family phosphatase [Chloroflexota bacterium]|nr:MAG: HAD family phosphatase [Chloroflexota bacterium]